MANVTTSYKSGECIPLWDAIETVFTEEAQRCGLYVDNELLYPSHVVVVSPAETSDDDSELRIWRKFTDGVEEATIVYDYVKTARREVYQVNKHLWSGIVTVAAVHDMPELRSDDIQCLKEDVLDASWNPAAAQQYADAVRKD